jgi:exodeoxyribonuclease-3
VALTIATFNVNSIKARMANLLAWLDAHPIDVLLLQETKTINEQFPAMELEERGYNLAIHGQKTYNGVAICSKFPIDDVITRLPGDDADEQARYIEAVISLRGAAIRVASAYVPNGQSPDSDKFPYKLRFLERLHEHWQSRLTLRELAVLGGDFNNCPFPIDVHDPKALDGTICYHPAERERLRALLYSGFSDAFRVAHPMAQEYSFWDYRANSFERGHGYRIDHLLLSPVAADLLQTCVIDQHTRAQEKASDHAPVVATLRLS